MQGSRAWTSVRGAVLVLAASVLLTPAAAANHVACGDAITSDTTLDSDLVDCPANGLTIQGSGVTLDFAGHSIDGTGTGNIGVVTAPGVSNVTVMNGAV